MNTPETETERLRLRKFTQDDIPALLDILQDRDVNRFLPWFPLKTMEDARNFYETRYSSVYAQPYGYAYAVCLTENSYQNMGMAKAYGYGKIRFSNVQIKYYDFDAMYDHFELSGKEFKTLQIEELIKEYKEYVHSQKGINLDEEGSIQDFLFMKTHIMEREETEYQTLGDFSKNRVLPTVRQIRENMEEIGK